MYHYYVRLVGYLMEIDTRHSELIRQVENSCYRVRFESETNKIK